MVRITDGKLRSRRRLMFMLVLGIASVPLLDRGVQLWKQENVSVIQMMLTLSILIFGIGLLLLAQKVRRANQQLDNEKTQLQSLFESIAEGVVIYGPDGKIIQCNQQAQRILALSSEQLLGKHATDPNWQALHEDGSPWLADEHPAMITLRTGEPIRQAVMGIRLPDGGQRWLSINTQAIADPRGQTSMVISSFTDVTESRQHAARLDLTISSAELGTWDWNVVTGEVIFNETFARMLGFELSELEPNVRSWERIVDRSAAPAIMKKLNAHLNGATNCYRSEHRLKRKDGTWMWVLDTGRVVQRGAQGEALRALGVHVDITHTKEMEQQLRESDRRFVAIFDQTFHLLWVLTPKGMIENANQAALRFTDVSLDDAVGFPFWESAWLLKTPGQQSAMREAIERARRGQIARFELQTGATFFDFSIKPVLDDGHRVTSLVAEALDITEAMRTRETLREAEDRLTNATHHANLGVWDWNPQTDVAWFSERWFSMLGYESHEWPHRGSTWAELLHPNEKEMVLATLTGHLDGNNADAQAEFRLEFRMRTKDNNWRWILSVGRVTQRDDLGRPTRVSGVHFDETDRKSQQTQRAQAQRLESIGLLAAGVAHEINTPMQFVSDNLEYLVEGIEAAERVIQSAQDQLESDQAELHIKQWLQRILRETGYERFRRESAGAVHDCRDGCQRVVNIVHAMRQLSHPGTTGFHNANLNEVITGATIVTRNRWKFVADVQLELNTHLPLVPCRAAELSQVFVNMLVNAADAMAEPSPGSGQLNGVIIIRSQIQDDAVLVTVQDNGSGIPADVIDRIFDPFFTTKPVGQGTGQGLAIAHDIIVNRHHGRLNVDSEVGRGTTFTIELPLVQTEWEEVEETMAEA